jgi:hypothetical protein
MSQNTSPAFRLTRKLSQLACGIVTWVIGSLRE